MQKTSNLKEIPLKDVKLGTGLLSRKNELIRKEVIPYQWKALNNEVPDADPSNAIENFRIAAGEAEGEFVGMVFQDSDVAKWLEAVAYKLATNPDKELDELADNVIELIGKAQQPDGYLNTYFTVAEPDKKWSNLAECHELYCAGHMMEAAVAYYKATGKRKLLDIMIRFADLIADKFGSEEGKIKGYPGHQEIELALVKLYQVTGEKKYLELAKYFLDERGQEPNYFDLEWEKRGKTSHWSGFRNNGMDYFQAHQPVREQEVAAGHSVRALYMYSGMVDIARETNDSELLEVCQRLWDNVTKKQMYVTGGVGSSAYREAFTFDYDLPNDTAYTETCAAIALVFFAWRMLQVKPKAEYADVMEKALYNGVLSGISEDGKRFFYVNPLEVEPETVEKRDDHKHVKPTRQKWFGCACCPPNVARLFASIGKYIYLYNEEEIYVNLYTDSTAEFEIKNEKVTISQRTYYPWEGKVQLDLSCSKPLDFTLGLRLPGWCRNPKITINSKEVDLSSITKNGYAMLKREWKTDDMIEINIPMPVEKIAANPAVRENAGKIALQRGPIVYCLEEEDNGANLHNIILPLKTELKSEFVADMFGGITVIKGKAYRIIETDWKEELYRPASPKKEKVEIKAIPYYTWANRNAGEMLVWLNCTE